MNIEPGIYEYDGDKYHFFGEVQGRNTIVRNLYMYSGKLKWVDNDEDYTYDDLTYGGGKNKSSFPYRFIVTINSDIVKGMKLIKKCYK